MLIRSLTNMLSNLAVALVMLFSGMQISWAIDALQQARQEHAAGQKPAAPWTISLELIR